MFLLGFLETSGREQLERKDGDDSIFFPQVQMPTKPIFPSKY